MLHSRTNRARTSYTANRSALPANDEGVLEKVYLSRKAIQVQRVVNHIEFIGPPGAGKSTIRAAMLSDKRLFGGSDEDALERAFFNQSGLKHRVFYRLLPPTIRAFYREKFLRYRIECTTFDDFIDEFPDFVHVLSTVVGAVEHQKREIYRLCKHACERYQLGISTVYGNELLCLDESFCQRAVSVLWRSDTQFPLKEYFRTAPTPATLIHIDAPTETCLARQRERGAVTISEDWVTDLERAQDDFRDACFTVSDYATSTGVPVIHIENVESIGTTVSKIRNEISVFN
jgi:hypothetical protein